MITAAQLRAARALAGLDQRKLAELSGLSLPTIQRMETSEDLIRGNVDSLTKLIAALDSIGIEFLGEGVVGPAGGRGVRFKKSASPSSDTWVLATGGPGVRPKKSAGVSRNPAEKDDGANDALSGREGW
jgi:transcriptional regulator with XRE-family HTH domain